MDLITNKLINDKSKSINNFSFVNSLNNTDDYDNCKMKILKRKNFLNNYGYNHSKIKTEIDILNTSVGDNYRDIVKNRKKILLIRKKTNSQLNHLNKKIDTIKNNIIDGIIFVGLSFITYNIYNLV